MTGRSYSAKLGYRLSAVLEWRKSNPMGTYVDTGSTALHKHKNVDSVDSSPRLAPVKLPDKSPLLFLPSMEGLVSV